MIEQEFILLIMNCKKYYKKAKFQKMTWLKQVPSYLKFYHVIGDDTLETEFAFLQHISQSGLYSYFSNSFNNVSFFINSFFC
jgi:hypothetical protein